MARANIRALPTPSPVSRLLLLKFRAMAGTSDGQRHCNGLRGFTVATCVLIPARPPQGASQIKCGLLHLPITSDTGTSWWQANSTEGGRDEEGEEATVRPRAPPKHEREVGAETQEMKENIVTLMYKDSNCQKGGGRSGRNEKEPFGSINIKHPI